MDTNVLEEIRDKFREEIHETQQTIHRYRTCLEQKALPLNPKDPNRGLHDALQQATAKLQKLNEMLAHVTEPDFGLCTGCNNQISAARLLLMPQSKHCSTCETS